MGFKIEIRELLTHRNIRVFPGRIRGKKNSSTSLQEQIPCEARGKHPGENGGEQTGRREASWWPKESEEF